MKAPLRFLVALGLPGAVLVSCSAPPLPRAPVVAPLRDPVPVQAGGKKSSFFVIPEGSYFVADLDGSFTVTKGSNTQSASRIGVDNLNLHKDRTFQYGLGMELGRHRLSVRYLPVGFTGSTTTDSPFLFKGVNYPAGESIKSDLDFEFWTARYDYPVWASSVGELRFGTQWYYWQYSARVQGFSPVPRDQDRSFSSYLPGLSLSGELHYSLFHLRGDAAGGWLTHSNTMVEFTGSGGLRVGDNMDVDIGYRSSAFAMMEHNSEGDFFIRGPFLSASIRF